MKTLLHWSDVFYFLLLWTLVLFLGPRNHIQLIGLASSLPALAAWILARHQLGRSFTIRARAHHLVEEGLYRWFSHPIYLFGMLSHLGVLVAFQQWWLLPLWLGIPAPLQWARIKRENKLLEAEFGQSFRDLRAANLF